MASFTCTCTLTGCCWLNVLTSVTALYFLFWIFIYKILRLKKCTVNKINLLSIFTFQIVIANKDACVIYDSLCQFSFCCKYKQNLVILPFTEKIMYTCMPLICHCRFRNWECVLSQYQPFPLCPAVLPMPLNGSQQQNVKVAIN